MKIHVGFTIEIPQEKLTWAREFMQCDTNRGLRDMLTIEAMQYLVDYLTDNLVIPIELQ